MRIQVPCENREYEILLERGALQRAEAWLPKNRRALIVTDSGVPQDYARQVASACPGSGILCIPAGEGSKSFSQLETLLGAMVDASLTRKDCLVAVGGGVVGDLSGFAASCYMRGIDFYNVPTTLLSQVDSSIGGKTAIDFQGLKNIVGAFYPPQKVIVDPDTLATLEPRQLRAGLAEVIKMAMTCDGELLTLLERTEDLNGALPEIIRRSLMIKKAVVEQDPREAGLRRVLNFGHTLGHAAESFSRGQWLHGECVAAGMLPLCAPPARARLKALLEKYGLPTRLPASARELEPYLLHDKKREADRVNAVFVEMPGSFVFRSVTPGELCRLMEEES